MAMKRMNEVELVEKIVFSGLRNAFPKEELNEIAKIAILKEHEAVFHQNFMSAKLHVKHKDQDLHYDAELVYDEGRADWIVFFDGESPDDACFDWNAEAGIHKVQFF